MDVRLPDGRIIRNVPEGTTRAELEERLAASERARGLPLEMTQRQRAEPERPSVRRSLSTGERIARQAATRFMDNVLAGPAAVGDLLAFGAGGMEAAVTPGLGFREATERQQQQFPASAFRAIPSPNVGELAGAGRAIAGGVGAMAQGESPEFRQRYADEREQVAQQREAQQAESPGAAMTGHIAGDVASLMTGRIPVARIQAQRPTRAPKIDDKQVADTLEGLARTHPELAPRVAEMIGSARLADPGANRAFQRAIDSPAGRSMRRAAGKAAETGLEGAVLGILNENDPWEMAGLAAGAQVGASAIGTVFSVPRSAKGVLMRAATLAAVWRLGQEVVPGVEGNVYEAIDSSFQKVAYGLTAGMASHVFGGRLRGSRAGAKLAEDFPVITDAINTIPRGSVLSLMNRISSEQESTGRSDTLRILETLERDPMAFGERNAARINTAIDKGRLDKEIDRLLKSDQVRSRLEEFE